MVFNWSDFGREKMVKLTYFLPWLTIFQLPQIEEKMRRGCDLIKMTFLPLLLVNSTLALFFFFAALLLLLFFFFLLWVLCLTLNLASFFSFIFGSVVGFVEPFSSWVLCYSHLHRTSFFFLFFIYKIFI